MNWLINKDFPANISTAGIDSELLTETAGRHPQARSLDGNPETVFGLPAVRHRGVAQLDRRQSGWS